VQCITASGVPVRSGMYASTAAWLMPLPTLLYCFTVLAGGTSEVVLPTFLPTRALHLQQQAHQVAAPQMDHQEPLAGRAVLQTALSWRFPHGSNKGEQRALPSPAIGCAVRHPAAGYLRD
jgi:hypothetical protein